LSGRPHRYRIEIGEGLLSGSGDWAASVLGEPAARAVLVSNPKVFGIYGKTVEQSLKAAGFRVVVWLMGDGERFKTWRTAEKLIAELNRERVGRNDIIVALGGGVVGDLAGFAAAIHLRGIRFLQIPTTLLAMIDSSVGGKTGVNSPSGKNLIGAFHQPSGVLVDIAVLETLDEREIVAGACEAVKHGVLSGSELFERTRSALAAGWRERNGAATTVDLLAEQIAFKARIVMNDETESAGRTDPRSRKILNFGHTLAHSLEKATNYRHFRHGEAVGYGIMFAAELSKRLELLDSDSLNLINDVVRSLGRLPRADRIGPDLIIGNFAFDKKNIGSELHWILIRGIGDPVVFPGSKIPIVQIRDALNTVSRKT
jgi:3-dehydroquinate synthase